MAIYFNRAEFVLSAVRQGAFIRDGRAQVTFAGRSNVGKSSVINRLLNRKNFARVGATPGKTTQVNYFLIDGKIYFTDLPGYGYAHGELFSGAGTHHARRADRRRAAQADGGRRDDA